jgi:hypothetical protein
MATARLGKGRSIAFNLFGDKHHGRHWTVAATEWACRTLLCTTAGRLPCWVMRLPCERSAAGSHYPKSLRAVSAKPDGLIP